MVRSSMRKLHKDSQGLHVTFPIISNNTFFAM